MYRFLARLLLRFTQWFIALAQRKNRIHDVMSENALLKRMARAFQSSTVDGMRDFLPDNLERACELHEARSMVKAPWLVAGAREAAATGSGRQIREAIREADPIAAQGATGDINLMLQNVNWKREINLSWLEFSRWGIQQIILISRLYWMKNPIVRRLVDVCSAYVFARGVEVLTGDEGANAVLAEFFERNRKVFGRVALMKTERQKDTDGNIFWALFPDKVDTGQVNARIIDALEMLDIISNPDDQDEPWYYLRSWTQRKFDADNGIQIEGQMCWYPAINFDPVDKPKLIRDIPVNWAMPIYHRKCGDIGKWNFGCPRIYPLLDWAKEAKRFLEACASIRAALSQFALIFKTKGGQQALDNFKYQMGTTIGPSSNLIDSNPPAIPGSTFGSGPGSELSAFKTQGAGFDPEGVRQYKLMCCIVKGVPETFLADVSTGNLATATSLDRPTETAMLALQEEWVEDLEIMCAYVLQISARAASGRLGESLRKRGWNTANVDFRPCARSQKPQGGWKYAPLESLCEAVSGTTDQRGEIRIQVNFPAIREGDMKTIVDALVESATLGNKGGLVVGIDEKTLVKTLYRVLDIDDGDELAELQYPEGEYDPNRLTEELPDPAGKLNPQGGIQPQPGQVKNDVQQQNQKDQAQKEALRVAARRLARAFKVFEGGRTAEKPAPAESKRKLAGVGL
jgi:hypothetical protein